MNFGKHQYCCCQPTPYRRLACRHCRARTLLPAHWSTSCLLWWGTVSLSSKDGRSWGKPSFSLSYSLWDWWVVCFFFIIIFMSCILFNLMGVCYRGKIPVVNLVGCLYYLYFIIYFLRLAKQSQFILLQNVVYSITLLFWFVKYSHFT